MPRERPYYGGRYKAPQPRRRLRSKELDAVGSVIQGALGHVDNFSTDTVRAFLPHLAAARNQIADQLRAWNRKEQGHNRFTAQKLRNALVQVTKVLDKTVQLHPQLARELGVRSQDVTAMSLATLEHELTQFSSIFEGTVVPINIEAGAVVASQEALMLKRFESSAKRYAGGVRDQVVGLLTRGILGNQSIDEVSQAMLRDLPGVFDKQAYKAERLVRTELMNTYNAQHRAGIIEAAEEDDEQYLMRWDASFDSRRCVQCASMDGQTIPLEGEFATSWNTKSGKKVAWSGLQPPAHPNCRCVLLPWMADWPDVEFSGQPPQGCM